MGLIILCALIGLIPAAIAHSKGHNFALWWLFGSMLFIFALPMAILSKADVHALDERRLAPRRLAQVPRLR